MCFDFATIFVNYFSYKKLRLILPQMFTDHTTVDIVIFMIVFLFTLKCTVIYRVAQKPDTRLVKFKPNHS